MVLVVVTNEEDLHRLMTQSPQMRRWPKVGIRFVATVKEHQIGVVGLQERARTVTNVEDCKLQVRNLRCTES